MEPSIAPSFHSFSRLPTELRLQIWQYAFPTQIGPALYSYRKGCWFPCSQQQSITQHQDGDRAMVVCLKLDLEMLDDVCFSMPLLYTNNEARQVALAWCRRYTFGLAHHFRVSTTGFHALRRTFHAGTDAFYIPFEDWDDCMNEPRIRRSEPDLRHRHTSLQSNVKRVAIPITLLQEQIELNCLCHIFWTFPGVQELLIVTNPPTRNRKQITEVQRPCWWVFEDASAAGGIIQWNATRGTFTFTGPEEKSTGIFYHAMEMVAASVPGDMVRARAPDGFRIRCVMIDVVETV